MFEWYRFNIISKNHTPKRMSNYSIILLKMNTVLHSTIACFESVLHPAAGKSILEKKKQRAKAFPINPKASPDSLNIREMVRKQDSFRRNPAP